MNNELINTGTDNSFAFMKSYGRWNFITKHFKKTKPEIDETMLALHISVMSFIHKMPPKNIPKSHTFLNDIDISTKFVKVE